MSWVLNDPYSGGTHLPDITVVTPAFAGGELIGFAANRAHHADVGGPTPGSMPADSKTLEDEGVVISPRRLTDEAIDELASQMRQPAQRRADLRAQLAANRAGAVRLVELRERLGADGLRAAMAETIDYSAVIAAHTLWLAARVEGIGMGWVSILDPAAVAIALAVPPEWRLIGYFCLGYPEEPDPVPALERAGWERRRPAATFLIRR